MSPHTIHQRWVPQNSEEDPFTAFHCQTIHRQLPLSLSRQAPTVTRPAHANSISSRTALTNRITEHQSTVRQAPYANSPDSIHMSCVAPALAVSMQASKVTSRHLSKKTNCRGGQSFQFQQRPMRQYRIHYSRLRFIEFLRTTGTYWPVGLLMWAAVRLELIWTSGQVCRAASSERDCNLNNIPEPIASHVCRTMEELSSPDYLDSMIEYGTHASPDGTAFNGAAVRARHADGSYLLIAILTAAKDDSWSNCNLSLVTFLPGEQTIATAGHTRGFDPVPGATATYHPGASLEQLHELHTIKLNELNTTPVLLHSRSDVVRELEFLDERWFNHMIARGVVSEITE